MCSPANLFNVFYPPRKRVSYTPEGDRMRCVLLLCLITHICFFLISLTFIGFKPMIADLLYASLVYSVYLTLSVFMTFIYLIALGAGVVVGLLYLTGFGHSSQLIFYIVNLVAYGMMLFFAFGVYMQFRKVGRMTPEIKETRMERRKTLLEGQEASAGKGTDDA